MASLMLHLVISNELYKKFNLSSDFMVGTIAPDILKKIYGRDESHYTKQIQLEDEIVRFPDIEKFLQLYPNRNDDYFIGYLIHLVQDKIWFNNYATKVIKRLSREKAMYYKDGTVHDTEEATKELYNDYYVIERYIVNKYGEYDIRKLKDDMKRYFKETEKMDIDEVIENEKISYKNDNIKELKIYSYEIIDDFINESIEKCGEYIKNMKGSN